MNTQLLRIAHVGPIETKQTQQGGTFRTRTVVVQGVGEAPAKNGKYFGAVALPLNGDLADATNESHVGLMCYVNYRPNVSEYTNQQGQTRLIQDFYVSYFKPIDL